MMGLARDIRGQSGPSISQKKGPDIRRAIQEDEDPSRAAYLFPADGNYDASRVLVQVENAEELKRLPPVQQNVRSDRPSSQAGRVARYSIPLTGPRSIDRCFHRP